MPVSTKDIIIRNGESYVALIDARRLDYCHQLEREHIHFMLLDEAASGWEDVEAGRQSVSPNCAPSMGAVDA